MRQSLDRTYRATLHFCALKSIHTDCRISKQENPFKNLEASPVSSHLMNCWYFVTVLLYFLCLPPDLTVSPFRLRGVVQDHPNGSVLRLQRGGSSMAFDPTQVTQLSWSPRAFLYEGFLTDEECDHLIHLAKDKLEKSMVADYESGKSIMSDVRTSSGMFLSKAQDEIVERIETRIAAWTFLPPENGEDIQVLHYEHGEKYDPHFDYFHDKVNQKLGGHRIATVLMYLSDVAKGGETIFPYSETKYLQPKDDTWSDCAKNGFAVNPRKGDALLFFNLYLNATTDNNSLHGSCPVIEGEKWSATKWIRVSNFEKSVYGDESEGCVDENENCAMWAKAGECQKNPSYMVGIKKRRGFCMKSCNVCSS